MKNTHPLHLNTYIHFQLYSVNYRKLRPSSLSKARVRKRQTRRSYNVWALSLTLRNSSVCNSERIVRCGLNPSKSLGDEVIPVDYRDVAPFVEGLTEISRRSIDFVWELFDKR